MKFINSLLICICLGLVATSGAALERKSHEAKLSFEVSPVKSVFEAGETVEADFVLRNVGDTNVIVARTLRLTASIKLEIQDAQEQPAKWCGRIAEWTDSSRSYVNLAPGQSVHAKLAISCVDKENKSRSWGYSLNKPGKYVLKATYRLPRPKEYYKKLFPAADVVQGPISAQPVTLELR
jgi:hypothetical protein